jgi:hypothetical protein
MRAFYRLFAVAALVAAGALAVPATVWAQVDTGSIDGRVADETKAAVPGASVAAKNMGSGFTRTTVSSTTGTFHIGALPAGTYEVTATLSGFATQVQKGVPVQVGSAATVDFTMKVAGQAETITVTGETPLIQTTKSDVGQVITSTLVENIPLNGRKFQDLSLLVPGTRPSNYYDPTKTEVGGISYGGATGRNVIISVDGGDNNDGVVRGLLQQFTAEAIQEYKVTTQRYSAEFGRSTGGIVNVITKSGTNEFHGSAFGFARDQRLNSETFFEKKQNAEKSPFKQQQFGGSVGGPLKKDEAHFFVAYERNRRDDFARVDTNGVLPDQEGAFAQPFRNHLLTAKLDFRLGDNNSMVARYSLEDQRRDHDFIGGNTLSSAGALNTNKIHSGILKNTTVMGNSKVNEILVLFQRFENNITSEDNTRPAVQTPDFLFGANLNTPQQTIQKRIQLREDFSFRKENWGGDHDFKVGAELLRSHYGGFFIPTLYGYFIFNNQIGNGRDLNAYLNGIADTFTGSAGTNEADEDWTYVGGYLQDDWKPSNRLTVNLGVRYEIQTGPYANLFDTITKQTLAAATGHSANTKQDKNNFGPRVGFAYDVNGNSKAVVRGGYGRYFDEIFQNITLYEAWSSFKSPLFFVSASPAPFTPNQFAANRDRIRTSFIDPTFAGQALRLTSPDLQQPYSDQFNLGLSFQPINQFAVDIDYVHATGKEEVGRWRVNTPQNVNTRISPAGVFAPSLGPFIVEGNRGHSKFDGVYVTGKVRASKLTVLSTYAWTKGMNINNDFNSQPHDITNANWELDWGPTPNDVRHRFTLGGVYLMPLDFQLATAVQGNTGKPINPLAGLGGLRNAVRANNPATGQPFERNSFRTGPEKICPSGPASCQPGGNGGLAFFTWDLRLSKIFKMGKARSFEVLFEVFNITDHANFDRDDYIARFTSPNFGTATDIVKNSQRQAEFGARFRF